MRSENCGANLRRRRRRGRRRRRRRWGTAGATLGDDGGEVGGRRRQARGTAAPRRRIGVSVIEGDCRGHPCSSAGQQSDPGSLSERIVSIAYAFAALSNRLRSKKTIPAKRGRWPSAFTCAAPPTSPCAFGDDRVTGRYLRARSPSGELRGLRTRFDRRGARGRVGRGLGGLRLWV